jgi:hypothetical protein
VSTLAAPPHRTAPPHGLPALAVSTHHGRPPMDGHRGQQPRRPPRQPPQQPPWTATPSGPQVAAANLKPLARPGAESRPGLRVSCRSGQNRLKSVTGLEAQAALLRGEGQQCRNPRGRFDLHPPAPTAHLPGCRRAACLSAGLPAAAICRASPLPFADLPEQLPASSICRAAGYDSIRLSPAASTPTARDPANSNRQPAAAPSRPTR